MERIHSFSTMLLICVSLFFGGCNNPEESKQLPQTFEEKLRSLRWVTYTPSHFNPSSTPPVIPSDEDLRTDLRTLRPHFDGIITYGLDMTLERVPVLAKEEGFKGCIAGVWNIKSDLELAAATTLAVRGIIDAICVGNEGIMFGWYSWEDLQAAMNKLRSVTNIPLTTSEAIHLYSDKRLLEMQFLLVNLHPIWYGKSNLEDAVSWVNEQAIALVKASSKPLLIKETGFPTCTPWNETIQADFYQQLKRTLPQSKDSAYSFAYFEAFDQYWAVEMLNGTDIGSSLGLFTKDRNAKEVIGTLSRLRKTIEN